MPSFWRVVNKVIKEVDLVVIVLDARFPDETRNREIEDKLEKRGIRIIYALNKSDLIKEKLDQRIVNLEHEYVFVSATKNLGTTKLRKLILEENIRPMTIGVLGYPNTGKSSLINVLKQRRSAGTSPTAGFTKGVQKIKLSNGIYLLDTPGVIPYEEKDEFKQSLISAKDPNRIKNPDLVAMQIIDIILKKDKKILENIYKISIKSEDSYKIIEEIAINSKWILKGGLPNIDLTARKIISDWQRGKIIV